jgi:hypothetical protein
VTERVLDVLPEYDEEEHVAEDVVPASVQEHRRDPTDAPGFRAAAGMGNRAGVERGVEDRRSQVWKLVEQPDPEIRDDQRHIHERKATGGDPVGERQHAEIVPRCAPVVHRRDR